MAHRTVDHNYLYSFFEYKSNKKKKSSNKSKVSQFSVLNLETMCSHHLPLNHKILTSQISVTLSFTTSHYPKLAIEKFKNLTVKRNVLLRCCIIQYGRVNGENFQSNYTSGNNFQGLNCVWAELRFVNLTRKFIENRQICSSCIEMCI